MRFDLCRALAEILVAGSEDTLLTRASTDRQERGLAFAAELLAPLSWLASKVSGRVVDAAPVDTLGTALGVPSWVVEEQIVDHDIARLGPGG